MEFIDLTGAAFGRLTVLCRDTSRKRTYYRCKCACGMVKSVQACHLRMGKTVSCGCRHRDALTKHGNSYKAGHSPTYQNWNAMKQRCDNPKNTAYKHYGGRGITYDRRWADFETFLHDVGHRPEFHTLDRIDPNGNYEPGNVRWAIEGVQAANKRNSVRITYNGETKSPREWAEITGIQERTIWWRIARLGWTPEEALTIAPFKGKRIRPYVSDRTHHFTHNGQTHTTAEWETLTGIPDHVILSRIMTYGWSVEKALTTAYKARKPYKSKSS